MTRLPRNLCPRDENGWRVPRLGTLSRVVYECLRSNIPVVEIYKWVSWRYDGPASIRNLYVIIYWIKHPKKAVVNARRVQYRKRQLTLDLGDRT
jgi:hypothetical protein